MHPTFWPISRRPRESCVERGQATIPVTLASGVRAFKGGFCASADFPDLIPMSVLGRFYAYPTVRFPGPRPESRPSTVRIDPERPPAHQAKPISAGTVFCHQGSFQSRMVRITNGALISA